MKLSSLAYMAFACLLLSSCYRMPDDDEFSVVPTTNNPGVTCDKGGSILPGFVNK